ncbi:MAG TPA: cell division protein FtsZ, partial [Streptosporangiaceae bacterium]
SVMSGAGSALMGIGSARGDDRAVAAAEAAISSPLLEASIDGAHGVLLSIQGGSDLGLFEINEAAQLVSNSAAPDANIIFGAVIDDALGDEVRVTVIAAGFDEPQDGRPRSASGTAGGTFNATSSSSWRTAPAAERPAPQVLPAPVAAAEASPLASDSPVGGDLGEPDSAGLRAAAGSEPAQDSAGTDAAKVEGIPAPRAAGEGKGAADKAGGSAWSTDSAASRLGDASSSSTRRRSVVFEEDDELDVPDFLK